MAKVMINYTLEIPSILVNMDFVSELSELVEKREKSSVRNYNARYELGMKDGTECVFESVKDMANQDLELVNYLYVSVDNQDSDGVCISLYLPKGLVHIKSSNEGSFLVMEKKIKSIV